MSHFSAVTAATQSPAGAVIGPARFTVITPLCVRLEYCPSYGFVDAPTLFATERATRDESARVTQMAEELVIETSHLRLVYRSDGLPFHAGNLEVTFRHGSEHRTWLPGTDATGNLGGPLATLDNVATAVPLPPGLLARDGWHLIDDSGSSILINGWATQRPGGSPPGAQMGGESLIAHPDIDWYLFAYGVDFRAALRSLSAISGAAALPRRAIFGSWYCRWHPYTSAEFRGVVQEYRDHGYPLDVLVMDMDWHSQDATTGYGVWNTLGWTGYTWNRDLLPDAEQLVSELKADGLSVVLNDHPADGIRENEERYAKFMAMLPPGTPENSPFQAGNRSYMEAFLETAHHEIEAQGVDFWWLDWQQDWLYPFVLGVPGLRHLPWLNHLYFGDSARADRRGQAFSRWGGWGGQRYPIQFSGDTDSNWDVLDFLVPFSTASGNAGCFYWAHDIGGFRKDGGPENFTRWIQFGALSASLRVHSAIGGTDRRPWLAGDPFATANREAYRLRSSLLPYIYSSARQSFEETVPLLRAMYIDHPEVEDAYQVPGQYLLGDHLLAAPITRPGEGPDYLATKVVWFPAGTWHHFLTGAEIFRGPGFHTITATLREIPLYVRAGVPIALQPFTERPASDPLTTLVIRCVASGSGETVLYEDDGETQGYLKGAFAKTTLRFAENGPEKHLHVSATAGTYRSQPTKRAYQFELWGVEGFAATINGHDVPVETSSLTGFSVIHVFPLPLTQSIDLRFKKTT